MILRIARDLIARFEAGRLSTKILVISLITTLLPLAVLSALFDRASTENARGVLRTSLQQQSVEQAAEIDDRLQTWQREGVQISDDPALRSLVSGGQGVTEALTAMARGQALDPAFRTVAVLDGDGRVVLSTNPAAFIQQQGLVAQVRRVTEPSATGVTDPIAGTGVPATSVVYAPILQNGQVRGQLLVAVDTSRITGFSNPTRLPADRFGMLVDGNGVAIGYNGPAPERVMYHVVGTGDPASTAGLRASGAYGAENLDGFAITGLPAALSSNPSSGVGQFHFPPTDRAVELGYTHLSTRPWHVAVMQDELAFLGPLQASTFTTVLYFLGAAVPVAALLYLVMRLLESTERQSLHDELTGLPNRRYFRDMLDREFRHAQRTGRPLSLINLDLDRFKVINDQHGHAVGDEVLKSFAGLLQRQVRSIDLPVRYGGEEFAILLPDTDKEGAAQAAEKVRRAVEGLSLGRRGSGEERPVLAGFLTVSAGVAGFPDDGPDSEAILRRADQAMYLAKSLGRNQVIKFGSAEPLARLRDDSSRLQSVVRTANQATVEALSAAIDARDPHTVSHSQRVGEFAEMIAEEMGLNSAEIEVLALGALLHDIGRIAVSESLIRKSSPLTQDERRALEAHTTIGYRLVNKVPFLQPAAPIVLHHHENFDGSGYPHGIAGAEIPLQARIIKVADAFEAMTTPRAYREGRPVEWALGELRRHSGDQFDPSVVQALISVHARHRLRPTMPEPAAALAQAAG